MNYIWVLLLVILLYVVTSGDSDAAGFQNVQADNYDAYRNCCNQQPRQRQEPRYRAPEPEPYRNEQQPIVGDPRNGPVYDTNPRQINGGQSNGQVRQ